NCCRAQVSPPSPVWTIVPCSPTAQPLLGSGKETPSSSLLVLLFCGTQVIPPSLVCRMVPFLPTAQPSMGPAWVTAGGVSRKGAARVASQQAWHGDGRRCMIDPSSPGPLPGPARAMADNGSGGGT